MVFSEDKDLTELVQALLKKGPSAQKKIAEAADFHMLNWGLVGGSGGRRFRDITGIVEALARVSSLPTIHMVDVTGVVMYFFFGSLEDVTAKLEALDIPPREVKVIPEKALLKLIARRIKDAKAALDEVLEQYRARPDWMATSRDFYDKYVDLSVKKLDSAEAIESILKDQGLGFGLVTISRFRRFVETYAITPEQFEKGWKFANNEQLPNMK
jgi:hypothetical protein